MQKIDTAEQFKKWLASAAIGDAACYHQGFLMADRIQNPPLRSLANLVWTSSIPGLGGRRVSLTQKRSGEPGSGTWLYLATRVS